MLCLEAKLDFDTESTNGVHAVPVEQNLESTLVKAVALFALAVICSCVNGKSARSPI